MARPTHSKIVVEEVHRQASKDFLTIMRDISRLEGWREYECFTRWMTLSACALRGQVYLTLGQSKRWRINEDRYLSVVNQTREGSRKTTMDLMSKALGEATVALGAHPVDFLGPIFMEVASNASLGQFFTPYHLSVLSARLTLADAKSLWNKAREGGRGFLTLQEPACGVGGMVLAANQVLREQGLDPAIHAHWHAVDLDWNAACGAYIQLALTNTSAMVHHGDALTMKFNEEGSCLTMAAVRFPKTKDAVKFPPARVRHRVRPLQPVATE